MITIYHPNLKKAMSVQNIRVTSHKIPNIVDNEAEEVDTDFVEFDVVGENNVWKDQIPYDTFIQSNPLVEF